MRRFFREYTPLSAGRNRLPSPSLSREHGGSHGGLRKLRQRLRQGLRGDDGGKSHTFDSFECAINMLAPACAHCGTKIIGHGLEAGGSFYCCDHCAERAGVKGLRDRV